MLSKLMIHFGELYTKGKNRRDFIRKLRDNLAFALKPYSVILETKHDHIYISRIREEDYEKVIKLLQNTSGIHAISVISVFPVDLAIVKDYALELALHEGIQTFKVVTKRKDKNFPLISDGVNREIASHILRNSNLKVDVHNPDLTIKLEIDFNAINVIGKRYPGLGGYPLGSSGKGLVLLSGGIDSPVAAYLTIRRGIKISAIHFAAPPYTSEEVIKKIERISHKLNAYQPAIRLYVVPFTALQLAIYEHVPTSYAITVMRRMMLRISQIVAKRHGCKILVTGESLGQVASQTLDSLVVINEVSNYPIIRPLATTDKNEIIKIAKDIGTYEISIMPFEDCCTIFANPNPVTSPHLDEVLKYEASFDYAPLISEAIQNIEKLNFTLNETDEDIF